jgi:anti-anti-sigma factor
VGPTRHPEQTAPGWPAAMTYQDELADVRDFVEAQAVRAGLPAPRAGDLVIAASEIAANTLRHTGGEGVVRIWAQDGEVICEFRDSGIIDNPRAGLTRPDDPVDGGLGLWVVRQVCDGVDIEAGSGGTIVRLHMYLAGQEQTVRVRELGSTAVLTPPAEIDATNAGRLREGLIDTLTGHSVVIVDMSDNTFCDSSGIRALVIGMQRARDADCDLRIVIGGAAVRRIFKVTGVDQVLSLFESMDEAIGGNPSASAG